MKKYINEEGLRTLWNKIKTIFLSKSELKTINGQSLVGEGDITIQGGGTVDLSEYAKLNSPVFTGTPTAPTKDITSNSINIATTKFVHDVVNNDLKDYIKTVNVNNNPVAITDNTLNLTIPEQLVRIKNGSEYQSGLLTDIINNVSNAVDYLLGYFVLDHSSDCDILVARDNNGYKYEIRLLSFLYNSNTEKYTLQLAIANEIFYIEWVEDDNRYEILPLVPHPTANGQILASHDGKWYATTPTVYYIGTNQPDNSQGNNGDLYLQQ